MVNFLGLSNHAPVGVQIRVSDDSDFIEPYQFESCPDTCLPIDKMV